MIKKRIHKIDSTVAWSLTLPEGILEKGGGGGYKLELHVYGCVSWNSSWCDLI